LAARGGRTRACTGDFERGAAQPESPAV